MKPDFVVVWIELISNFGLSHNTVKAYRRVLTDFQRFCDSRSFLIEKLNREQLSQYVRHLLERHPVRNRIPNRKITLSNATVRQHITVLRQFYGYLVDEGFLEINPVYRNGQSNEIRGRKSQRAIVPEHVKLPWIPSDEEWMKLIQVIREQSARNKLMFALAYDAALRREELCLLNVSDIDPSKRLIHLKAHTTKSKRDRVVPYAAPTGQLLAAYLSRRRLFYSKSKSLFLSESPRNYGEPISAWTWTKTVEELADKAGVSQFTTHSFRHLRLTDLARAGWELHEISNFAGHRCPETTLIYIHLSGRDLALRINNSMGFLTKRILEVSNS
jgi:integrase/recombinase XerD